MTVATVVQINIVPFLSLLIILVDSIKHLSLNTKSQMLRTVIIILLCLIFFNTTSWLLNGNQQSWIRPLIWISNCCYFFSMFAFAVYWFFFTGFYLDEKGTFMDRKYIILFCLPVIIFMIYFIITLPEETIFTINEENYYQREEYYFIHPALNVLYVIASGIEILWIRSRTKVIEKRKLCLTMLSFLVFPMIGIVLQTLFFGTDFVIPSLSASMLMLYLNLQQANVSTDMLTHLNNRKRLDEYLERISASENAGQGPLYVIQFDIDHFKSVNDWFGHMEGDRVLRYAASQMKEQFGDTRAFLARHGGDEFSIIWNCESEEEVQKRLSQLQTAIGAKTIGSGSKQMRLSLSIGYVRFNYEKKIFSERLMAMSDIQMYKAKESHLIEHTVC